MASSTVTWCTRICAVFGLIIVILFFHFNYLENVSPAMWRNFGIKPMDINETIKEELIEVVKLLNEANKHVRGTKTSDKLKQALNKFKELFEFLDINYKTVTTRKTYNSTYICPETYMGTFYGKPRFYTGFVIDNCTFSKPMHSLITVLVDVNNQNVNVSTLLKSIKESYIGVRTVLNFRNSNISFLNHDNVTVLYEQGNEGKIWNKMLNEVKTPFVLFARDVIWLNYDARLDRLMRQIEQLGLDAVGGSFRNLAGNWFVGCQQNVHRNYSLVYEAGYDESIQECEICDHIDGPFVTKLEVAKKLKFSESIEGEGVFEDFFLRLRKKSETAVCPDSMFFTDKRERSFSSKAWTSFARKWDIYLIKFSGKSIRVDCPAKYDCKPIENGAFSPCCLQELALLLTRVLDACLEKKIWVEAFSGSSMGALKFNGILPWEVDADITYSTANATIMKTLGRELKKYGYRFTKQKTPNDYMAFSKHWFCEVWSTELDPINDIVSIPINQTTVNLGGKWIPTVRNPVNFTRNRYGHEILQHAQSWRATKDKSSWITYKTNRFLKCGVPGHHACLDRYNGDGNLQFRDPIP